MRVPLRLERSAALFVSMHFASFGGQGSKVLVGCRHVSMAHSIFYHFKGHLALTLTYVGYPYRGGGTGPSVCGHVHNHIKPLALPYETTRGQDRRRRPSTCGRHGAVPVGKVAAHNVGASPKRIYNMRRRHTPHAPWRASTASSEHSVPETSIRSGYRETNRFSSPPRLRFGRFRRRRRRRAFLSFFEYSVLWRFLSFLRAVGFPWAELVSGRGVFLYP